MEVAILAYSAAVEKIPVWISVPADYYRICSLCFYFGYIDRTNLGFAGIQMSPELGLTASTFGFGAGLFFIGYFIFEVPSNLCLAKFGAAGGLPVSW